MKNLFIMVMVIGGIVTSVFAETTLSFTTADNQKHPRSIAVNNILTECFKRMGIQIKILPMPSGRSLKSADDGIYDGNFVRTGGIKVYPNLVQVPERVAVNYIVVFSKNTNIKVDGWKSLKPYNVVHIIGWKNCEREIKEAKSIQKVKDEKLLFTLLDKGRAEVGVFGRDTGYATLKELGITSVKALEPPIDVADLFLYINKKHEGLIPQIVQTLKDMKSDGTFQKLTEDSKSAVR